MYKIKKRFGEELGLSCAFRQWRDESHCRFVHGYCLTFDITFACETLNERNWVLSFGEMDDLKQSLKLAFDHKMIVALDDPMLDYFEQMHGKLWQLDTLEHVGCEKFAQHVWYIAHGWLFHQVPAAYRRGVRVESVWCYERLGNGACFIPKAKETMDVEEGQNQA